jgi:uncharacterized 2Fe-2S/4Fe-4S cluster protein (DUF4445 family)
MTENGQNEFRIEFPEYGLSVRAEAGDSLLDAVRRVGIPIAADCNGMGKCGKCTIIVDGAPQTACKVRVDADVAVYFPHERETADSIRHDGRAVSREDCFGFAVDLGTTTIAVKLVNLRNKDVTLFEFTELNEQRAFGADVISRIDESLDDASALSRMIRKQLRIAFRHMLLKTGVRPWQIERITVAGNTAMSYILLALPCRSLGAAPFTPEFPLKESYGFAEVFGNDRDGLPETGMDCPVTVMPYISAFVGGDISAGLLSLPQDADDFILLDLGTNGEMVYRKRDKFLCTSTAAGPAFEGGNISCGMGAVRGAISSTAFENGSFRYETVGNHAPVGLCGPGILDVMACLLREGFIDTTGAFAKPLADNRIQIATNELTGDIIYFTQKDIREFQMAKSAIRTGIEILMREMDSRPVNIFLAGGFAFHFNIESALITGLLPRSLEGRIVSMGNTSLLGAEAALESPSRIEAVRKQTSSAEEILLANHPMFMELFLKYMEFE